MRAGNRETKKSSQPSPRVAAPAVVGRRGQEPNVLLTLAARDGRHRAFGADPLSPAQARFP